MLVLLWNCFNPYFIGLPILILVMVTDNLDRTMFQSLFYWITYSYNLEVDNTSSCTHGFNPYFIGLPILIRYFLVKVDMKNSVFQSLFYWITYSYVNGYDKLVININQFQSLFYWITYSYINLTPHPVSVILGFNPYFIGLPILIRICSRQSRVER